jgi:hypothetical protein
VAEGGGPPKSLKFTAQEAAQGVGVDEVVGKLKRISVGTIDLPIDKSYIFNDPTTVASVT